MRFNRVLKYLSSAAITAVAISACQNPPDNPTGNAVSNPSSNLTDCRTVQHAMGETEICGNSQKVVAVGPAALEALLILDIQPVGFADHFPVHQGSYDNPSQQIPYVGDRITSPIANIGISSNPSLETIFQLQPDLILGDRLTLDQYNAFSEIAPTLPLELSESEANLMAVAQAVDLTEQAEEILIEAEQKVAAINNGAPSSTVIYEP